MAETISPETIVVYSTAPDYIFDPIKDAGIQVISFPNFLDTLRKPVI